MTEYEGGDEKRMEGRKAGNEREFGRKGNLCIFVPSSKSEVTPLVLESHSEWFTT
jgi:hypothetical protein